MIKYLKEVVKSSRGCDADLGSSLNISELGKLGSSSVETGVPQTTRCTEGGSHLLDLLSQFPGADKLRT